MRVRDNNCKTWTRDSREEEGKDNREQQQQQERQVIMMQEKAQEQAKKVYLFVRDLWCNHLRV